MNKCISTHGADGYMPGTYVQAGRIYCGSCRRDISNDLIVKEPIYEDIKWNKNIWKWFNQERRFVGYRTLSLKQRIKQLPSYVQRITK